MNLDNSHITTYFTDLPIDLILEISILSTNFNLFLTCNQLYRQTLHFQFRVAYLMRKYLTVERCFSLDILQHPWLSNWRTFSQLIKSCHYKIETNNFELINYGLSLRKVNWFPYLLDEFEALSLHDRQRYLNQFLVEACKGRHIELIELILQRGGDPSHNNAYLILNSVSENDFNLTKLLLLFTKQLGLNTVNRLIKGCSNIENIKIIDLLLERGGDVNFENGCLIRQQAYLGNAMVVRYLMSKGADPKILNQSTLLSACQRGHPQLISLLIQHGCDPNFNGGTPILFSVSNNHLSVITELVKCGANPQLNDVGFQCLVIGCKKGNLPMVKYLIEQLNISVDPINMDTIRSPLVWSILHHQYDTAQYLISQGAQLNHPNNCCLSYCRKTRNFKMIELIERSGGIVVT